VIIRAWIFFQEDVMAVRETIAGGARIAVLMALALPLVGCAGPRLGSRLFQNQSVAVKEVAETEPHYVAGQRPLPSQQAARPAAVPMAPQGQYAPQTAPNFGPRHVARFFNTPHPGGCSS
jgi:hypothetical protein